MLTALLLFLASLRDNPPHLHFQAPPLSPTIPHSNSVPDNFDGSQIVNLACSVTTAGAILASPPLTETSPPSSQPLGGLSISEAVTLNIPSPPSSEDTAPKIGGLTGGALAAIAVAAIVAAAIPFGVLLYVFKRHRRHQGAPGHLSATASVNECMDKERGRLGESPEGPFPRPAKSSLPLNALSIPAHTGAHLSPSVPYYMTVASGALQNQWHQSGGASASMQAHQPPYGSPSADSYDGGAPRGGDHSSPVPGPSTSHGNNGRRLQPLPSPCYGSSLSSASPAARRPGTMKTMHDFSSTSSAPVLSPVLAAEGLLRPLNTAPPEPPSRHPYATSAVRLYDNPSFSPMAHASPPTLSGSKE